MTWNHVYKQVTHFLTTKAIWSITSRTDGMISNSHSFRKLSLLNCGSILVISAIVFAVSDWENTSPEKLGNYWELIKNMKTLLFKVAINTIYLCYYPHENYSKSTSTIMILILVITINTSLKFFVTNSGATSFEQKERESIHWLTSLLYYALFLRGQVC